MDQQSRPVALVTGGARGIGLGISQQLAKEGWDLAVNGVREESAIEHVLSDLRQLQVDVIYCRGDISNAADRQQIVTAVKQKYGQLQLLVNNAGITSPGRDDILVATEESFDKVFGINLKGPFFLTQLVANWMIEQQHANKLPTAVINISSISGEIVSTNRGDYCMTKTAIGMATKLWAVRLAEHNIPVYEIRPGVIQSDMTAGVTDKYDQLISAGLTLEKRWGKPEDVGKAVAMLARGDLPYATGQVLKIDGGMTLRSM